MLKPWRGQADKLTKAHKDILEHFEERGIKRPVFEDGHMITKVVTKYWVKWDGESAAKEAESPSAALPHSRSGWSSQRARALALGLKLELQLAASSGLELARLQRCRWRH